MNKVSVQSLNDCFNVSGEDYLVVDDSDCEILVSANPWNKGLEGVYKHDEETKKLITGRPKGSKHSEEWKQYKSTTMKGENNHFYGKPHTEDAKQRIIKRHYKIWKFVSPTGEVVEEYTTLSEFCRKYSLHKKNLLNLIKGKVRQYKGWTVPQVAQDPL